MSSIIYTLLNFTKGIVNIKVHLIISIMVESEPLMLKSAPSYPCRVGLIEGIGVYGLKIYLIRVQAGIADVFHCIECRHIFT